MARMNSTVGSRDQTNLLLNVDVMKHKVTSTFCLKLFTRQLPGYTATHYPII